MDDNRYNNSNGTPPNFNIVQPRMVGDDWDTGRRRKKRGPSVATLVICCLVTALIGGGVGGYLTMNIMEDRAAGNTTQSQVEIPVNNSQPNSGTSTETLSNTSGLTSEQIVAKAQASVVGMILETQQGNMQGEGNASGVIISEDGYIITNYHVVEGASKINVVMPDGSYQEAEVIGSDEITDLAVVKVDATGLTPMTFADSSNVAVGQKVYAIGNPLGAENGSVTQGIISAIDRQIEIESKTMTLLQTDAAINPGNSGGALVNENGDLVGVVNAKTAGVEIEGLGYAIPANSAKEIAEQLIDQGYISGRPQLGIGVQQVQVSSSNGNGGFGNFMLPDWYNAEVRLQITNITEGSAADEAGLQAGDLILEFDGQAVTSLAELNDIKFQHEIGDVVRMKVQRDNEEMEVDITLKENTK